MLVNNKSEVRRKEVQKQLSKSDIHSRQKIIIGIVSLIVIISIIILASLSFFGFNENKKTVIMNYQQYKDDIRYSVGYGLGFESLEPGDTLEIEDEIRYIASEFDSYNQEWVTYIWFNSTHHGETVDNWRKLYYWDDEDYSYSNYDLTFKGNLTNLYKIGDKVIVTLHIVEIKWYGYEIEYFEEMLSNDEELNYQYLPETCIEHV